MNYLSTKEIALLWGVSERRIRSLIDEGRVKGATKIGREWVIPEDAPKPNDGRKKSGAKMDFIIDKNNPLITNAFELKNSLAENPISFSNKYFRIRDALIAEWAYNANRHFGNSLTLDEIKTIMSGYAVGGKLIKEHLEIINFIEAAEYFKGVIDSNIYPNQNEINHINYLLLKNIGTEDYGYYRLKDLENENANLNGISFIAIPTAMENLMKIYPRWGKYDSIIVGAVVFGEFLKIKPFEFANQKVAEILLNGILYKGGYYEVIFEDEDKEKLLKAILSAHEGDYRRLVEIVAKKEIKTLERIRDAKRE